MSDLGHPGHVGQGGDLSQTSDDQSAMAQPSPVERRVVVAESARIMATEISVQLAATPDQEAAARAAARACMAFFTEVDERLSRFKPESELSRLNRAAGQWFRASELLFECVEQALTAAQSTGGLFDPTLLHAIEALGYDRDFAEIARHDVSARPAPDPVTSAPLATGGWRAIALGRAQRRIRLPMGVGLDLGGIAKGWAADLAFARYCSAFPGALINLGGDLRLHGGPQPGQAWSVGIRDPRDELVPSEPHYAAVIAFSRGGLATSGAPSRWWLQGGQRQHHLLDPRTGQPMRLWMASEETADAASNARDAEHDKDHKDSARLIATATALAPTATQAEIAAKVALLRGYPAALRSVERGWSQPGALHWPELDDPRYPPSPTDANVALLLAFGNGEVALSENMRQYLATWGTQGAAISLPVTWSATRAAPPDWEG